MSSKLREALEKCAKLGRDIDNSLGSDESTVWNCRNERLLANAIAEIAKAALAEPLRNCDVGTAEEQEERYLNLKREFVDRLTRCPAEGSSFFFPDSLYWAQMPY